MQKRDNFQFGLYYKNEKYYAERISNLKEEKPLLRFKSFTQGLKAVSFIETQSQFKDVEELKKVIHLNDRNELWLSAGRTLGEKSFLIF